MDWATQIRNRIGIHGETTLPPKIEEAWKWKQFAGIIDELTAEPYEELQHKAVSFSKELRQKNSLVDRVFGVVSFVAANRKRLSYASSPAGLEEDG